MSAALRALTYAAAGVAVVARQRVQRAGLARPTSRRVGTAVDAVVVGLPALASP